MVINWCLPYRVKNFLWAKISKSIYHLHYSCDQMAPLEPLALVKVSRVPDLWIHFEPLKCQAASTSSLAVWKTPSYLEETMLNTLSLIVGFLDARIKSLQLTGIWELWQSLGKKGRDSRRRKVAIQMQGWDENPISHSGMQRELERKISWKRTTTDLASGNKSSTHSTVVIQNCNCCVITENIS